MTSSATPFISARVLSSLSGLATPAMAQFQPGVGKKAGDFTNALVGSGAYKNAVAAGYADGYARSLSNRGQVLIRGRRAPVVGRVCMQLTAVDVTEIPGVQAGEEVTLLGGQGEAAIGPEELADWWGTIPYEVLCLLGLNRREYVRS